MNGTFFDGHDELYHHAKFGEDRTTRAGYRCENVVFVFLQVIQEVNFPKSFFSICIRDGLWLCTYVAVFPFGVRWRHNRAPNLEPRYLVNFVPV